MTFTIKLNKVQEEQFKEVMRREKRVFNQVEINNYFIDMINHIYLME